MASFRACTIVARNYSAQARVLVRSFTAAHPDIPFFTLIIDGDESDRLLEGVGAVVLPQDLGLSRSLLNSMIAMYDVTELATALKPAMLMHLVRSGADAAAYFDPDIRIYENVRDVFETAQRRGILLTPHTLYPIPRDGLSLSEKQIMQSGMYNLGFVSVGASAYRFLAWWHERMQVDAIIDIENSLFTDQRWIDWVPALFDHEISRDQGLNVAYWNLHEREIQRHAGHYSAGTHRLRFFHFSGYDPARPWLLSTQHMGERPRILLSEHLPLQALCDDYAAELVEFGHPEFRKMPYRFNVLNNGLVMTRAIRRFYRQVTTGVMIVPVECPDPVDDPDAFVAWLLTPMFGPSTCLLSPLDYAIWFYRGDVGAAFPDPLGLNGPKFRHWLETDAYAQGVVDRVRSVRPDLPEQEERSAAPRRAFGWSVLAYATSEHGVGEAGRRISSLMRGIGTPVETVGIGSGPLSRQQHSSDREITDSVNYENAVICVNADQVRRVSRMLDVTSLRGRKAGVWFWELESFPEEHLQELAYLTEVWVASSFTYEALLPQADRPLRLVRLPIVPPSESTRFTRRSLGMPEGKFVFLTNFDFLSVFQRKNPIGTIRAYRSAFGPDDGAILFVKSINGDLRPVDAERMRREAAGRPDIVFEDSYVTSSGMKAMIELADCYVSLHRSEGYGLNMADAMARSTPVIATAYSGNLEFMTPTTAELIPFEYTEVGNQAAPYDPLSRWAEPDLDSASRAMRRLFDDRAIGDRIARDATEHVLTHFSSSVATSYLRRAVFPFSD
ncbi:MAG: glycosyltransferase [Actinomycetota bacterium]|nr:glycosyltransferase [Actinomycetota bacterium]